MAYKINSDCNNCGACEPECPNTAIATGDDIFEISLEKCTECVGFHAQPQCVAVCPVDACVSDAGHVESEVQLLAKVKALHPNKEFGANSPSHFRK